MQEIALGSMACMQEKFSEFPVYIALFDKTLMVNKDEWRFNPGTPVLFVDEAEIKI
jgi:hypothetical protein